MTAITPHRVRKVCLLIRQHTDNLTADIKYWLDETGQLEGNRMVARYALRDDPTGQRRSGAAGSGNEAIRNHTIWVNYPNSRRK